MYVCVCVCVCGPINLCSPVSCNCMYVDLSARFRLAQLTQKIGLLETQIEYPLPTNQTQSMFVWNMMWCDCVRTSVGLYLCITQCHACVVSVDLCMLTCEIVVLVHPHNANILSLPCNVRWRVYVCLLWVCKKRVRSYYLLLCLFLLNSLAVRI